MKDVVLREALFRLMRERRTVRKFLGTPVAPEALRSILEAGRLAPSGANAQPWFWVLVEDAEIRKALRAKCEAGDRAWHAHAAEWIKAFLSVQEIEPVKTYMTDAPELLVVFGDRSKPYWRDSVWISIAYMLLEIERLGLATVTYTPGRTHAFFNELLNVPAPYVPVCVLPVGHAGETPDPEQRKRKPVEQLLKVLGKK